MNDADIEFHSFVTEFLQDHEWGLGGGWHVAQCHACLGNKDRGHKKGCRLARALTYSGITVRWDLSEQIQVQDL